MDSFSLDKKDSVVAIVDIQDKLAAVMSMRDEVIKNCVHLIELAKMLKVPVLLTEQYPKGLGQTVEEIRKAVPAYRPLEKMTFSCCDDSRFLSELRRLSKKNVILAGMETHICVLQTCIGLLKEGLNVHVVNDAVCSRTDKNWITGIEFMRDAGAVITCTETVLFQVLKVAGTEEFKAISKRIR